MKSRTIAIAALALLALSVQSASAQSVGYNYQPLAGQSDALLTVPFTQPSVASLVVSSVTGSGVTVSGGLTGGAYANTFFVRFTSGNGAGLWSTITTNTTNSITFADTTILSSISAGDSFVIYPHETLGTTFPDSLVNVSFEASPSAFSRRTEVLIPNTTAIGINKPAAATYFYFNNEWRRVGAAPTAVFNDTVLPPQQYFVLRNGGSNPLKVLTSGQPDSVPVARLLTRSAQTNDIAAGAGYPVQLSLAQLELGGTPAFETSTSVISRKDELLVFNNNTTGINKPASATYFYFNGAWRRVGASPATSFDNELLTPGSALLIRKASGTPGTFLWSQQAPY